MASKLLKPNKRSTGSTPFAMAVVCVKMMIEVPNKDLVTPLLEGKKVGFGDNQINNI